MHVERKLFTCSNDSQEVIFRTIEEKQPNRIVIAACSPRTHESLFRETLRLAGLNDCLVEIANIRNHNEWVHGSNRQGATDKAKDLVRMAVAKVSFSRPVQTAMVPIVQKGLVVGGGITCMTAVLNLAEQGFTVRSVEQFPENNSVQMSIIMTYLNRLSDYLFVLARYLNKIAGTGDVAWKKY